MVSAAPPSWRSGRIGPALAVIAIHILFGYALLAGLKVNVTGTRDGSAALVVLNLRPPPPREPPRKPPPPRPKPQVREGGGAPPRAPAVSPAPAPIPIPALPAPPPVIVTPPILTGGGPAGGGTGGLGAGQGSGSGGAGSGSGEGEGEGAGDGRGFTSARQTRGRFRNSDFPASARSAGRLRIGVRYAVGPSGRIDQCEIIEPSGYPEVDAMTCRVITTRYRFKPARDEQGIPVTQVLEEDYSWRMDRQE